MGKKDFGKMRFRERGFLWIVFQENALQEYGILGKWDDSILRNGVEGVRFKGGPKVPRPAGRPITRCA